jgi:hypothetical protein
MTDFKRWRGLRALIGDAVEHGSSAIERVHIETARRPFAVLEQVPGIAEPVQAIHGIHDAAVASVYASIRGVNRLVGATVDAALEQIERVGGDVQGPPQDGGDRDRDQDS